MAPDASWAVTVAADGTVRTWGTGVTPRVIRRAVPIHDGQPTAVALWGDRVRVLWATGETTRLHENVQGAWPRDDDFLASAPVQALALSPSGALAVIACADATLRMLNVGTGEFGRPLAAEGPTARALAIASDQGPVVAAFADGSVRRYDFAARTWDIVGSGPGIDLLAVSPDGGTVIAVGANGTLVRWNRSGGAPLDYRVLDTAVSAITVDGTGGKVLAGRADGSLWLYDMMGGPPVEFAAPASAAPPPLSPPEASARSAPVQGLDSGRSWATPVRGVVDDDVRFTVYRPQTLSPGAWGALLVFAHKTDLVEEAGKPPLDPTEQVEAIARAHFGNLPVRKTEGDARSGVIRGTRLRITADLPGIRCDPASAEFDWWEPVHHVEFRLLAAPEMVGSVVRGSVRIWCGPLILGEVSVAISITGSAPAIRPPAVAESAPRYRKIFPSYSHHDRAIVDGFTEIVRTFGDEYLRDVIALRSGEQWRERLLRLIEEADVFQLFWSSNSMRSPYCREEWEHALALGRPFFVRPFYWEDPRPEDRANGLPPVALDALEFAKVTFLAGRAEVPTRQTAGFLEPPRRSVGFLGGADTGRLSARKPVPYLTEESTESYEAARFDEAYQDEEFDEAFWDGESDEAYWAEGPQGHRIWDAGASHGAARSSVPYARHRRQGARRGLRAARRGRLVVAGLVLVLVLIVVAAILAFLLR